MGKPIATTDLEFTRNICGEAALYFVHCDVQGGADQIIRPLADPELDYRLRIAVNCQLNSFDSAADRAKIILSLCERRALSRKW